MADLALLKSTIEQVKALRPDLHWRTMTAADVAALLNAPRTVANPDAGQTTGERVVPKQVKFEDVVALLPPAVIVSIYRELGNFLPDLQVVIEAQDREFMNALLSLAVQVKGISVDSAMRFYQALEVAATFEDLVAVAIAKQDRAYLMKLLQIGMAAQVIEQDTLDDLAAMLAATETVTDIAPDTLPAPSYSELYELGRVTTDDVFFVMSGLG